MTKIKIRELLGGTQMDDRTPSQLLRQMKALAGPLQHSEDIDQDFLPMCKLKDYNR